MKRITEVMTPKEAELLDQQENLNRTPGQWVEALLELRNAWIPADQRRIARTFKFIEFPRS